MKEESRYLVLGETLRACENRSSSIIRAVAAYRNTPQSTRHKILKEKSTTCPGKPNRKEGQGKFPIPQPFHHRGVDTGRFAWLRMYKPKLKNSS